MMMVDNGSFYAIAVQCAKLNDQGCVMDCACCQFNVFNYGLPVNEAALLKANAYTDYYHRKEVKKRVDYAVRTDNIKSQGGGLLFVAIIVGLIMWGCGAVKSCTTPQHAAVLYDVSGPPTQRIPIPSNNPDLRLIQSRPDDVLNVPAVLRLMQRYGVSDVNRDGKIDCIDYTLTFRRIYGPGASIIINKNPRTGMNHMFIRLDGYWGSVWIEPQGTPDRYSMGAIWGTRFDPYYNTDVTDIWGMW